MENYSKWTITDKEKEKYIDALSNELIMLRNKAEVSQEELSYLIGVSRQTYGSIERKNRKMSWSTYLALLMFYDYNKKTHHVLRAIGAFPHEIIKRFNDGEENINLDAGTFLGDGSQSIINKLDSQALHSIRTMIMLEYARCTQIPGDAVIKAFDGIAFTNPIDADDEKAADALKSIKESKSKQ